MNILVVGGGGREHAIAESLSKSPLTSKLVVAPGNPGIKSFAKCYPVAADDIHGQCKLAKDIKKSYKDNVTKFMREVVGMLKRMK